MNVYVGNRLTMNLKPDVDWLILCLEQGGERLKDEEIALKKQFQKTL